jgi:PAS domain S-box-containing protein
MAVTSVDKRWLEVNDRLCEILGYSRHELHHETWVELTHPDDMEPNLQFFAQLLAGEIGHFTLDKRLIKKDRSIAYTTIHIRAFCKDDGSIDHVVALIEDITARKQAEEALRRSEERLRLAQQVARVGTFEWNVQTGLNTWTPELEALHGLSPGSFPKTEPAWENLIYPDDRAEALRRREQTLETGQPVEGEWRVLWPDGSVHRLAGRWQAFKDESGKPVRLIGVNIDISERKRAEKELRLSEDKYRTLVETSPDAVMMLDLEGHITLASQRAVEMHGAEHAEELFAKNPLEFFAPKDQEKFHTDLRRTLKEGVARDVEYTFLRKDGSRLTGRDRPL